MKKQRVLLRLFLLCGAAACPLAAGEAADGPERKALKVPGIEVDLKKREVRVAAAVCLDTGILEYLVCLEGTFEHETVFSTRCRPSQLHLALLTIGLVPDPFRPDEGWWHGARRKGRSRVNVEVAYEQEGKKRRRPVTEFLVSRENEDGAVADHWVFTGSVFFKHEGKNQYGADHSGIVIGIIPNGSSVIQFGEEAGVPYRGDDLGLEVNARTTPPVGTKVTLIFTPHEKQRKPKGRPRRDERPSGR